MKFHFSGPARRFSCSMLLILVAPVLAATLSSCTSTDPRVAAVNKIIAKEPRGDYYVGRRYYMPKTRWWGFLRKPGQPWKNARPVIMNESRSLTPDRLPESGTGTGRHGFDHNYEYIIRGRYTGRTIYDPNANIFVPEFRLDRYTLRSATPGFLFHPEEVYSETRVPDQATRESR